MVSVFLGNASTSFMNERREFFLLPNTDLRCMFGAFSHNFFILMCLHVYLGPPHLFAPFALFSLLALSFSSLF